ncbi:MAG TPA: NYN domain-containing protein [Candidatus Yonathbacteria bacterium]|nr:NYN domain-containing protein [Candidatus Yonathbacteria bacterium]
MQKQENNYAFIDSQNLYRGIESLGWKIDWNRFRKYLLEKYSVQTAYLFIGYIPQNDNLYASLQKEGFILKFKPVLLGNDGKPKGNVDADMVLQVMVDYLNYDKAIIISSDGDFYSLVRHLYENKKLKFVLSPHKDTCSSLLKKTAKEKIVYMNNLRKKIGKMKNTA